MCAHEGKKMFIFQKIWYALFSYYLRFEICSFALSPTNWCLSDISNSGLDNLQKPLKEENLKKMFSSSLQFYNFSLLIKD